MASPIALTPWLFMWLVVTCGHVLLTRRWAAALRGPEATTDDLWFDTTLAAIASLALVVHLTAAVAGLGAASSLTGLGLWHAGMALATGRRARRPAPRPTPTQPGSITLLEILAAAVFTAVVLVWIATAADSFEVTGADAAHYHVPVAVNLALGGSPLDLPATPHLYPMTMSALAAWHILPTGDLLLVDLAMALPFLLLASSCAVLFRLTTDASGLAFVTWPLLALSATPMVRASAMVSADLLFAAAFLALLAQGLRMWARGAAGAWDVALAGLAAGLLVGSKATGLPALALITFGWIGLIALTRGRRWRDAIGPLRAWPVAAGLAAGVGGIWLIRNWLLFGSPVAPNGLALLGVEILPGPPFEPTPYLSVLGDRQADSSYSLGSRTAYYVGEWLGPIFLPWLALAVVTPIDAWLAWRRGTLRRAAAARLGLVVFVLVTGVPLLALLTGAPWTSLEWTNGYSLRYALPLLVVLPLLSLLALFPLSWRWVDRPGPALAGGLLLASASLWALAAAQRVDVLSPRLAPVALAIGLLAVLGTRDINRRRLHRPLSPALIAGIALAAAFLATPAIASRSETLREEGQPARLAVAEVSVLQAIEQAESAAGVACATRRFAALTRFNQPLALQSGRVPDAIVVYAARDVEPARRAGPLGACDYAIATRAVLGTEKGEALLAALFPAGRVREIADTGSFVVLAERSGTTGTTGYDGDQEPALPVILFSRWSWPLPGFITREKFKER